ncbi:MAG: DeoR/GlpR family DNA-binding transcription regulator [Allorhizobium sp.]
MLTHQRQAHLLDLLRRDGQVIAKVTAQELGLSEDTIRRDLREMAAEGLLKRVHGGAMPLSPELPDFSARLEMSSPEKRALGQRAAGLVKPGQLVFLDGGSTTAEIARQLPRDMALTVATHSPTIAAQFEHHPLIEVILIGGRLYKHSMVSVGATAAAAIASLRPDIFFLGVTAIHPVHGLSTGDFEEAAIKRQIANASSDTYVTVTAEKFDRVSPCLVLSLTGISGLIAPAGMAAETLSPYKAAGVTVLLD